MANYPEMINRLRPTCALGWQGNSFTWGGLVDYVDPLPAPTQAECDAEWLVYLAEQQAAEDDKSAVTAAQVESVLQDITARIAQIDNRRTVITADLSALAGANTAAFKQIVGRMLTAEDNTLFAERRELNVLERLIKAIRRLV